MIHISYPKFFYLENIPEKSALFSGAKRGLIFSHGPDDSWHYDWGLCKAKGGSVALPVPPFASR